MKNKNNIFVEYNDDNISHVESGPDYGQTWNKNKEYKWNEYLIDYSLKCYRPSGSKYRKYNILHIN